MSGDIWSTCSEGALRTPGRNRDVPYPLIWAALPQGIPGHKCHSYKGTLVYDSAGNHGKMVLMP